MELIAADYAPSNETNGYRAEIVESRRNMVAGRYRNRFGPPARHDQCAGWDFLAPRRQVICQHHDCRQRIAEHGSAGGHGHDLAVFFEEDAQRAAIEIRRVAHAPTDHET